MKIIFHPAYDGGYYAEKTIAKEPIGTKIVGLNGLLETLELHSGHSGIYPSDGERIAEYMKVIETCKKGQFYESAYETDAFGVARKLLQWRDQLVMAGWTTDIKGGNESPKLKALREIESKWLANEKGVCDRWKALLDYAKRNTILRASDAIECRCNKELLPYLVVQVLESCNAEFSLTTDEDKEWGNRVSIISYHEQDDIYQLVASQPKNYADTVFVNRDNVALNHELFAQGQPLLDARINNSNPQVLQLFKLALSIYSRPLNLDNLLSYMQLPIGPIPGTLRWKLAQILLEFGGFGELEDDKRKPGIEDLWDWTIDDYFAQEENKNTHSAISPYLTPIKDKGLNSAALPKKEIKEYINALVDWLGKQTSNADERILQQLHEAEVLFMQLNTVIGENDNGTISYDEIDKYVRSIYSPTSIRQASTQVGSLKVVSDLGQLVDAPENLVWLDCYAPNRMRDEYDYLSSRERSWLQEQGVILPDYCLQLELQRKEMMRQLSRVNGSITLCVAAYHHNKPLREHPLVAELKMTKGKALREDVGSCAACKGTPKDVKVMQNKLQYDLKGVNYKGRKESNTSIDLLINYPFDYTVQHVAKLYEPKNGQLKDMFTTKGLVAHLVIQQIIADTKGKTDLYNQMRNLCSGTQFDTILNNAIRTKGLSLLLKENDVERSTFSYQLQRSVNTLVDIMDDKVLIPESCELNYDASLTDIGDFGARIDMVLTNQEEKYVIIDFKWSFSKKYREKLETNTSIQLELYKQAMIASGKDVVAVGYYMMPQYKLVTTDLDEYVKDNHKLIEKIAPPSSNTLFEQIKASYKLRLDQLKHGVIEEGECEEVSELEYTKMMKDGSLLPVGELKKTTGEITKGSKTVYGNKSQNRFARNIEDWTKKNVPANEQATSYPIMKGRLK